MPYKKGSLKGQLTTAEIRKLISAHNKLSKITIPPRSTRDAIMSIISKAGFRVNHEQQKLEQTTATKKDISLEKAKDVTKRVPKTEQQKKQSTERMKKKKVEKEKELKLAKKEGVKEFKQKKAEAKKKKQPPPPKKKKQVKKEKLLAIEDKNDEVQSLKENRCGRAVAHATSIIRFYEEYNGILKDFPDYKTKKEMIEDYEDLKKGGFGDCSQEEQATIRKAIKLHENPPKKKGKVKQAVEKIEDKKKSVKAEKTFKVERTERSKMISQLKQEYGNSFNPFKILGITASQETPELVKQRCRELRLKEHPDKGGDKKKFDMIQKACDVLMRTQKVLKKSGNDKDVGEAVKKPVPKKQEPVSDDSRKEIIDDWGSDANNVMIEQNFKKLKDGIVGLWDSNKKFINIDGIFQFDKKLFNELFMKYPAQKVIDGLKKFMLYATDSDDEERIGQSEFKNWFEIRDGRIQSQIRGKELNASTLNKMIKEWDETFGKKKEVKKEVKKEEKKEEKVNDKLKPLLEKLENPEQYLKPVKARQETLYAVSSLLLDKNISFKDFKDIIDSMSVYDDVFGMGFAFSFNKGQAPPKWRKKLSILIRKGIKAISFDANPDDIKNVWTEWTKLLPKSVKTEPTEKDKGKDDEKVKKQFDESKKLIKQFEKENKGFEKKDFSKLKKRYDYEQMINYKLYVKGANMMLRLNRMILDDDMKKKVQEENNYNSKLKQKIDKIYKDRK
ncbi:MAG: hypothetical protein ACXAAH_08150 [Promethearchaeota archaeon]|jgi:hypothetical protein